MKSSEFSKNCEQGEEMQMTASYNSDKEKAMSSSFSR